MKGEITRNEEEIIVILLSQQEKAYSVGEGRYDNGCPRLCLLLCDQKDQSVIKVETPDNWRTQAF